MRSQWRVLCAGALLLGSAVWAAPANGTEAEVPVKETLARTPEGSKPVDEQIRELGQTVRELQQEMS